MAVALSSLRVTSEMDVSGYTRSAAEKVAADQRMIASEKARHASMAQADAQMARAVPGMASVSKALLDGYGAGAQFEAIVRRIGNAVDRGMGLDRANTLLDAAYRKFGLTADAAKLAEQGFVSVAGAVGTLNRRYDQLSAAAASANAAMARSTAQTGINRSFGIGEAPGRSAQESADAFLADFGGLEGIAKAKAQEAASAFSTALNTRMVSGTAKSARDSAAVFEAEMKQFEAIAQAKAVQAGTVFSAELESRFAAGVAKSARDSASIFETEFKRLDTIAQQKAEQAGAIFGASLSQRLIAGVSKSARDAAAVFEADFARIATVAQQKAEQAGSNFQRSLTEALGGGGPSATSRGATYEALTAQVEALDRVEQARAAHRAQQAQAGYTTAFAPGLDRQAKSAKDSADAFLEMARAEEQTAAAAAALRAQINPLDAEMVKLGKDMAEYRKLLNAGAISSHEFEQAQVMAAKRLSDVDQNMRKAATGGRVLSGELANLGYQVNDVITGIALGQSPFMILAQQGGQFYQIISHSKAGLMDFVSAGVTGLRNFLTVGRLAFGGVAAAAGVAAFALNDYLSAQQKVQMGLMGSGRASGATTGGINAIATGAATPAGLSVSEARNLATALATTGKIANDNILPIVKMGKDIAHIYGIEAPEAATKLADAFSDPVRGAEQLNARLGFMDAAMQRQISTLVAQNRVWEAQRVLQSAAASSLEDVSGAVAKTTKFWTILGNAISNAWDATGEFVARQLNLQNSDAAGKINEATEALGRLQKMRQDMTARGKDTAGIDQAIDREIQKRDAATAALERYGAATISAQQRQQSLAQAAAVRSEQPQIEAVERLTNAQELLVKTMIDVQTSGGPASEILKKMGMSFEQLANAVNVANTNLKTFKTEFEGQSTALTIANQSMTAFSPSQKGDIARRQSREATIGARMTSAEKDTLAEQAYGNAVKQVTVALSEAARQRALSGNQSVASIQLEIDMLGKTIGMQAEMRANLQARQQLEQEASQYRTAFDEAQMRRLEKINALIGQRTQAAALAAVNDNIKTGSQTSLLSPEDVAIAQQLKSIYPDVATALDSVQASGLRTNQALSSLASTMSGQITTGLADIAMGQKSIAQGAGDMAMSVARAIEEMIIKLYIVIPLMRALQSTVSSMGFGFGGGEAGGAMSTGAAGVGGFGGLYANGQAFGRNVVPFARGGAFSNKIFDVPTLFKFAKGAGMANGVMGEAGPEAVMPLRRGADGKLGVSFNGGGGGGSASPPNINVKILNYGKDDVSVGQPTANSNGGFDLEVMVGQAAANQMAKRGSALRNVTDQRGVLARR